MQFHTQTPGRYRVSITSRRWIDVVLDGHLVRSADHQGRAACKLPHKVEEFDLPAKREVTVQLGGQSDAIVGLAITGPAAP